MRWVKVPVAIWLVCAVSGCDPLNIERAAQILGDKVDQNTAKVVTAFLKAVDTASKHSTEWQALVDQARKSFDRFPTSMRIEGMAFTDFLIARAKENLGELEKITALINEGKYEEARAATRSLQGQLRQKFPPCVGTVSPSQVSMIWPDHDHYQKQDGKLTVVEFVGFNFDPDNKSDLLIEIQDNTGKKLRTAWDNLVVTSPYLAQFDVAIGSGVAFRPDETRLVLFHKGKALATVPVTWGDRPPVPAERFVKYELTFDTTNDDKEGGHETITFSSTKGAFLNIELPGEGWGPRSRTVRSGDCNVEVPTGDLTCILRLTDGPEVNIGWNFNVSFDLVTDRGRHFVFSKGGLRLDTTGPGKSRSSERPVPFTSTK
jgi:hypothetical protein